LQDDRARRAAEAKKTDTLLPDDEPEDEDGEMIFFIL